MTKHSIAEVAFKLFGVYLVVHAFLALGNYVIFQFGERMSVRT